MEIIGEYQTTLRKALSEIDENWESYNGLIVCGTHSPTLFLPELDKILNKIKESRVGERPFLGICFGHQLAGIEYARNVLGIKDATSEEFQTEGTLVVKKLDKLNVGLRNGETYWNNYELAIDFEKPDHFFTSQSHPEYQSSIDKPHPLLVNFIKKCKLG